MTATELARLLHAKRTGRGKWLALCPAHEIHGKHRPSLSIAEGRKTPVVFRCMSAGCTQAEVLKALGLTWKQIMGDQAVTKEMRGRWSDEKRLDDLRHDRAIFTLLRATDHRKGAYWAACERNSLVKINALESKLIPEEVELRRKRDKVHHAIENFGWDKVWEHWLSTERGKSIAEQFGRTL